MYINYINKVKFLATFKVTFKNTFYKEVILGSFRGARLVLFDLDAVILKLDIRVCTPLQLPLADAL